MPRMLYGEYIEALLAEAKIEKRRAEIVDVQSTGQGVLLTLADGQTQQVDRLVLATGNLAARDYGYAGAGYTGHIWSPEPDSILSRDHFSPEDEPVLIIGTGLTTIDAIISLRQKGYAGQIIMVSRHGHLPQPHVTGLAPYPAFLIVGEAPRTALGLVKAIRGEIKRAQAKGIDWRAVTDALRADTSAIWMQLPESERKKLLPLLSIWGSHRHRMPPQSSMMIADEILTGKLKGLAAHVKAIRAAPKGLYVTLVIKGREITIEAAHVLNCSGPNSHIAKSGNRLLLKLLERGIITPGSLGMGIAATPDYRVKGNAENIFILGPQLSGERLETIAVPELRQQAEQVASKLLATI